MRKCCETSSNSKSKRCAPAKKEGTNAKKYYLTTDSEGGLTLPPELEPGVRIGDEYATWKEGNKIFLAFTKNYRGKRKIPEHAYRGKVEPALREITVRLPMPVKTRSKKAKAAAKPV